MEGVNSHIQSLNNTDYFEICASVPKPHPYFFSEIPNFILGIAENCRKFRTVREYQLQNQFSLLITNCVTTDLGTTLCMLNVDFMLNVIRLYPKEEVAITGLIPN